MSFRLPTFKSIQGYDNSNFYQAEFWHKAREHYDKKEYKLCAISVLEYLNRDFLKGKKRKQDSIEITVEYSLAHIDIIVTNSEIRIKSKLLYLPKQHKKVILRRVAEFNFNYFDFARVVLDDGLLHIDYKIPLALANPDYLFDVIYEIIYGSDKLLAELIFKYEAKPLYEIKRLPENQESNILALIKEIKQEYFSYAKEFREKNRGSFKWDIGVISLYKLVLCPYLRGDVHYEIKRLLEFAYDGDVDLQKRIDAMESFFQKLIIEELKSKVFDAKLSISDKKYFDEEIAKEFFEDYQKPMDRYYKNENKFALSYLSVDIFLRFLALYNVNEQNFRFVNSALTQCSKKETSKCYKKLYSKYYSLLKQDLTDNNKELIVFVIMVIVALYFIIK